MLMEFLLNNAFLAGATVLFGSAALYLWVQPGEGIAADAFAIVQKINQDNALVIDLRPQKAFAQGKIVGSQRMDADVVEGKAKALASKQPLVLVCENGHRSLTLARKIHASGCQNVSALRGGLRAWREANQPTLRK